MYNAARSPGYPSGNLKLQALAAKAAASFPPPFVSSSQTGCVETTEGNRAVERGRQAMNDKPFMIPGAIMLGTLFGISPRGYPSKEMVERELGGLEGIFTLFGCHYCRMFADPRMNVLFDSRHPDTNVSALDHGKRVASALMDRWYGTNYFESLGRGSSFSAVTPTHRRAKSCPMRPDHHRRAGRFTTTQRDAWIGHVCCAAEEVGASNEFQRQLGGYLAASVDIYAPFMEED